MPADEDSRDSIEQVLAQFDERKDVLDAFCTRTRSLIEACLREAGIRYQSVQARRKRREKLKLKYQDPQKHYRKLDDITDQAALRVIVYYEDDIDRVAELIKREFEVDPERSVDKRETEPDHFGYYALNLICRHSKRRRGDVEYKRFADFMCEIQVTSVLRHAWSEIEHDWYDSKTAYPTVIRRRFYRLAALLELAESEFIELRNKKSTYKQSVAIQVEANVRDLPIDVVSLGSFIDHDPLVASLDSELAELRSLPLSQTSSLRSNSIRVIQLQAAGITTIQTLRQKLSEYRSPLKLYLERCLREVWKSPVSISTLARGSCVSHLAMMLIGATSGTQGLMKTMLDTGFQGRIPFSLDDQTEIARQVLQDYNNR